MCANTKRLNTAKIQFCWWGKGGGGGGQTFFNNQYLSWPRFDFQNWYIYNELCLPSQPVYAKPDCRKVISCVSVCLCLCFVSFLLCLKKMFSNLFFRSVLASTLVLSLIISTECSALPKVILFLFYFYFLFENKIQWKPLNVITVNVISCLFRKNFKGPIYCTQRQGVSWSNFTWHFHLIKFFGQTP